MADHSEAVKELEALYELAATVVCGPTGCTDDPAKVGFLDGVAAAVGFLHNADAMKPKIEAQAKEIRTLLLERAEAAEREVAQLKLANEALCNVILESAPLTWAASNDMDAASRWERKATSVVGTAARTP